MRQLMTLPKVKAIVMRLRAKSPPLMRQHPQSQRLSNLRRIQPPLILQVRRLLIRQLILRVRRLLIRQRMIPQARRLLIRLRVIPQVSRLLIRQRVIPQVSRLLIRQRVILQAIPQPRRQRKRARMINHARSCALY
jgi:hypothetical protein